MGAVWLKERDLFLRLINEEDARRRRSEVLKRGGNRKITNEIPRVRGDVVWKMDRSEHDAWNIGCFTHSGFWMLTSFIFVALWTNLKVTLRSLMLILVVITKVYESTLSLS
jgi:hypothetical protein